MTDEIKTTVPPIASISDQPSQTQHKVTCGRQEIHYTATAGKLILKEEITQKDGAQKDQYDGETPRAEIFYVAYTKNDVADPAARPLTFAFNGGPGSPSIWVHMGLFGPKRIQLTEEGKPLPPPSQLIDNEYSILDMSDIIFIDPVGTGYSRAVKGEKANHFWGWQKDIESIGEFIRLYITQNERWASPKFIAGESYGTTRTTGLADYLSDRHGLYLNGIMLISTALDFSTLEFHDGNDLPYALYLPSYAAAAWHHKQIAPKYLNQTLEDFLNEVRSFVTNEYLVALFKGDALTKKQIHLIAKRIADFTGISADYVERANLRITLPRFSKELLRTQKRTIGRFDARFIGIDRDSAGEEPEDDPSSYEITGTFAGALNDYLHRELGYKTDLEYSISNNLWKIWDYKEYQNQYVQLEEMLRRTIVRNKFMRVWVLNGYYDLATPFYAAEYVFNHLHLDESLRQNLDMTYYEAGHMMYLHLPSLVKFRKDAEKFYSAAIKNA